MKNLEVRKRVTEYSIDAVKSLIVETEYCDEMVVVKLYRYVGMNKIPITADVDGEIQKIIRAVKDEVRAPGFLDEAADCK